MVVVMVAVAVAVFDIASQPTYLLLEYESQMGNWKLASKTPRSSSVSAQKNKANRTSGQHMSLLDVACTWALNHIFHLPSTSLVVVVKSTGGIQCSIYTISRVCGLANGPEWWRLSSRRTKSQAMPLGTGSPYPAGRMSWNIAPFFLILAFSPFTIERRPLQPLPRFWREKETIYLARYGVAALANALQGL
ncbi:hypothetical protein B0T24DRAFT_48537 [Lasiosphaeria ovina]|uniref:Uncharacterized protein n=1 Tax=Lasiosphaeria ovina TaxID=92902 RepID=A0AAE0NKU7_9PEZI|nr:hypothetical protein B0T24DRAFT_48537 [Lasiosphaeria ovina]